MARTSKDTADLVYGLGSADATCCEITDDGRAVATMPTIMSDAASQKQLKHKKTSGHPTNPKPKCF